MERIMAVRTPQHRRCWGEFTRFILAIHATLLGGSWSLLNSDAFRPRGRSSPPRSVSVGLNEKSTGLGEGASVVTAMSNEGDGVQEWTLDSISSLEFLPRIIVFDLDNTLWTPELYQVRQRHLPQVDKDVRMFPDAVKILEWWIVARTSNQDSRTRDVQLAIASRTSKAAWANHLLDAFRVSDKPLRSCFQFVEIQTGSKKEHMSRIRRNSGVPYHDMLFVDDDAKLNLGEVSSQLGMLCCHTPRGVTVEHLVKSLHRYSQLKASAAAAATATAAESNGNVNDPWMGYVLTSHELNIVEPSVPEGTERAGRVKFYSPAKRFGFLVDEETKQELFVHESKVPSGMKLQVGDVVRFQATLDSSGRAAAVVLPPPSAKALTDGSRQLTKAASTSSDRVPFASVSSAGDVHIRSRIQVNSSRSSPNGSTKEGCVSMPCFSMSQPFVALLLNGYKTVESRNNPMFMDLQPGTRILVHCGQRDWPDTESYKSLLPVAPSSTESAAQIEPPTHLRAGFSKGAVVGVVTIGKTWRSSAVERDSSELQRRVLAPADGIGTYCTEIVRAQWLQRPYKMRGSTGVYSVEIPIECLPPMT